MLKRIHKFIALFSIIFLSCNSNTSSHSKGGALKDSLEVIYGRYGYSPKGLDTIALLYRCAANKDAESAIFYYDYVSHYHQLQNDYNKASLYADSLLQILNQPAFENKLYKERVKANIYKADILYAQKRYRECYYYYCNGMAEAGQAQDAELTDNLYSHLSMFLYEEGDHDKAIFYNRQLLKDVSGGNHTYERLMNNQGVLDNMGISFLKLKKGDSAIACFNKAIISIQDALVLQPDQQHLCRLALGVVYGNLGQAYALTGRNKDAERIYGQSIAINKQPGYANENALLTQAHLAQLYYDENDTAALHQTLRYIKAGLDSVPNEHVAMQWNYLMSHYHTLAKQPGEALTYLEQYLQQKEENAKKAKVGGESNIFEQMKLMQSQYNMRLLTKDNEIKNTYLCIAGVLFALTLTIAILLFVNAKKSKRNVQNLTVLNNEIQEKQTLLQSTLAVLEKQNIEKQHILHVVAHDLRNPLSAIYTLADILVSESEPEEENREYLELIRSACMESSQLINSILEIAENADVKYNYDPVDVNVLLSNSMHLLRMKAKEKSQHIRLTTSSEKGMMYVDAEKMNRVISNLVTNAIKFSPSGSDIEIAASVSEQHVTIQVKDSGIGIPEKYHDCIFNMFTEAKRSGTNGEKTFGLGLSISKQIVEKHHGHIWFETMVNKGTTFFIQLSRFEDPAELADSTSMRKTISV